MIPSKYTSKNLLTNMILQKFWLILFFTVLNLMNFYSDSNNVLGENVAPINDMTSNIFKINVNLVFSFKYLHIFQFSLEILNVL